MKSKRSRGPQARARLAESVGFEIGRLQEAAYAFDEVAAEILAMLDDAAKRVRLEAVAAVGMSAGGALASLLAFHHPERFHAIAVFATPPLIGMNMQNPQSVIQRGLYKGLDGSLSTTGRCRRHGVS